MENKYKKLGKNTFFMFLGKVESSLVGVVMLPFYTHWLSPVAYGMVDLINTYALILMGFVTCCIADSIFLFPKEADDKGKSRYFTSGLYFVFLSSCICAFFFLIWTYIAGLLNINDSFTNNVWSILVLMLCLFLQNYTQQFTLSLDKVKVFSIAGVVLTFTTALFAIIFIPLWGLKGYLFSLILANLTTTLYTVVFSRSYKYIRFLNFDKGNLIEMLKYSIPLIPNGIMWWLVNGMNRPIMDKYLGVAAIGIFAVASKFPAALSMLSTVFGTATGISLIEEFNKPNFSKFFNNYFRSFFFFLLVIGGLMAIFSEMIISIFADSKYHDAWLLFPFLILGVIFQCASGLIGGVFMAEKKSKYFFYSSVWGGLASLFFTFIFIKYFSLMGAALAVCASFFVMVVVRLKYAWKHISTFSIRYYVFMLSVFLMLSVSLIYTNNILYRYLFSTFFFLVILYYNKKLLSEIYYLLIKTIKTRL